MTTTQTDRIPQDPIRWLLKRLRWTARIIGLALGSLILVIVVGEGGLSLGRPATEMLMAAFFMISAIGLFLGCRLEFLGGVIVIASMGGFYLVNYWASGFSRWPGGWVFPLIFLMGLLYILCALLEKRRQGRGTR